VDVTWIVGGSTGVLGEIDSTVAKSAAVGENGYVGVVGVDAAKVLWGEPSAVVVVVDCP